MLKVLIGFYAKREEQKYIEDIEAIRNRIGYLQEQKVEVITTPAISQKVIDDLGNYIHLNFQNWQNEIKYVAEFVKTGFTEISGAATTRT